MSDFKIVPAHLVPSPNRERSQAPAKAPAQAKRFPCFSFSGKGAKYLPAALQQQADQDAAQSALVLLTTDALIRAQGILSPIPTRGALAAYLENPDPELQAEAERQPGRTLVDPGRYNDRFLRLYVERLTPFATAHSSISTIDPPSPRLAAYLLGGLTLIAVEELCHRVMEVMEIPTPVVDATLADAMSAVGFGPMANHTHADSLNARLFNWSLHDDHEDYLVRRDGLKAADLQKRSSVVSVRQQYLLYDLPRTGSFAMHLLDGQGAYKAAEQQMIARIKPILLAETADLFNGPTKNGMTEFMYERLTHGQLFQYRQAIQMDDEMFSRAVRRVYEKPWDELDFHADFANLRHDVEVMIARRLISRVSAGKRGSKDPVRISAVVLLGMALLTGIPVCKWVSFALQDLERRGETFITTDTLDEVIEMLEMSEVGMKAGACIAELREYQVALRSAESAYKARFAWKLRRGSRPFWTAFTYGPETYYLEGYNRKDEPQYKFSFDPYLERD